MGVNADVDVGVDLYGDGDEDADVEIQHNTAHNITSLSYGGTLSKLDTVGVNWKDSLVGLDQAKLDWAGLEMWWCTLSIMPPGST
jgi:hypothetical protein